jgi:RimJ/RimL family protein N-acetyltransferase
VSRDGFRTPISLEGRYVRLVPVAAGHAADLVAASQDPEVGRLLRHPPGRTPAEMQAQIGFLLELRQTGAVLPFTTVLKESGQPIGMTSYADIDRDNRSVQVGGTWTDSRYWRTPVNSECKLLLLRNAFEEERVHRLWLQTDARNVRSRAAIERLGAVVEWERREDVPLAGGSFRTSRIYGILETEWPTTRRRLEQALERPWSPPTSSPSEAPAPSVAPAHHSPVAAPVPLPLSSFRPPVRMEGRFVRLVPLDRTHLPGLVAAGRDPAVWTYLRIRHGDTPDGMAGLVEDLLELQGRGEVVAFTILAGASSRVAGITRYLDIDRINRSVEVGTWLDRSLWGSPVNTDVKFLMFRHAFEVEGVHRVELMTDDRNQRSQRAIERLGAVPEGRLREHRWLVSGIFRTSLCYSVLAAEWPSIRERLDGLRARPWDGAI